MSTEVDCSLSDTTCSSSKNDTVERIIHNDKVRYVRKGYGLFFAFVIFCAYFAIWPAFLRYIWKDLISYDNFLVYNLIITIEPPLIYLISNIVMYFIYTSKIEFLERYRIYPNKKWPWEEDPQKWKKETLPKVLKMVFINMIALVLPLQITITRIQGIDCRMDFESFPSLFEIMSQIFFFMLVEDFTFYWVHRIYHHPKLYKFHKVHHEFYNAISIATLYAHPLEHLTANALPSILGFVLLRDKAHFATFMVWSIIRVTETIDGHSGYEFSWSPFRLIPFSGSSEYHNFHHSHNSGVYASFFTYLDTLFGTNTDYFKHKARRDRENSLNKLRQEHKKEKAK